MMKIKIKGRKPEKILERLTDVNIYSIKKEKDGIVIKIKEKDFKKIEKRKTIYDLEIISTGKLKINKIFLSGILFSILVVIFFSNLTRFLFDFICSSYSLTNEARDFSISAFMSSLAFFSDLDCIILLCKSNNFFA